MEQNNIADGIAVNSDSVGEQIRNGREWQKHRFSLEEGYSFWLSAYAVRSFPNGFELPKDINASVCGYLYRCAMMLQPKTNIIVKHYKNYDRPLDRKALAEELGLRDRQFRTFFKVATEKRIIKEYNHRLYMNPLFFIRSRKLTWELYTLFQEDLDAFLPQWVIDRFNGDVNA